MGTSQSSYVRHYPQGPPACAQCPPNKPPLFDEHSFLPQPTNQSCFAAFGPGGCVPVMSGMQWQTSPVFLLLYLVWAITGCCATYWACTNNNNNNTKKRQRRQLMRDDSDDECSGLGTQMHTVEDDDVTIEYFRFSRAELVAKVLLVVNGLALTAMYLLLCIDFYLDCENDWSLDNLCFFGTYRVFGNYTQNSEAFFALWFAIVAYSLVISMCCEHIIQWTRVRVHQVEDAEMVRLFLPTNPTAASGSGEDNKTTCGVRLKRKCMSAYRSRWFCLGRTLLGTHPQRPDGRFVTVRIETTPLHSFRYFVLETIRYDARTGKRISLSLDQANVERVTAIYQAAQHGSATNHEARAALQDYCGKNAIPLDFPDLHVHVMEEFTSPFYAYQLTIYLIWCYWTYWFIGGCLLLIVIVSGASQVYMKRKALREMHQLAKHEDGAAVKLDGKFNYCNTAEDLVPGDVVRVDGGGKWTVPADLVVCRGSCAVDESGLSGESMPRSKTALHDDWNSSSILYAGTLVLEASEDCEAVVLAIGSEATRGKMLSQVLFPTKLAFQFEEEFTVAVLLLLAYALFAFFLVLALQSTEAGVASWPTMLSYGIMTVSQILSPMLKLALVAGRVAAVKRLRTKQIACMDQDRLDICGKVQVFCFDKTGTLTEPTGLRMMGIVTAGGEIQPVATNQDCVKLCAVCHSLSNFNGQLLGPSVEVEMFSQNGKWKMVNENLFADGNSFLQVKRRFQFDQTKRTMSALIATNNGENNTSTLYCKGAPESLALRCKPCGIDFVAQANALSAQGCYVLAMATRRSHNKELDDPALTRDDLEQDMDYLGLVVFRNELKSDAALAIQELKLGRVRTVMITGDNLACAIYVAKQAKMLHGQEQVSVGQLVCGGGAVEWSMHETNEELAVCGEVFDHLRTTGELHSLLPRIRVFARMSPAQKVQAVEAFIECSLVCAMAGDGGNDSGALRAAHVGLSYSYCEASVVAPFTSKSERVMACVDLLIEGRASMHTSLSTYKFLVVYGLMFSLVKFISFYYGVLMSLFGYILIDMLATVPLTYFMTTGESLEHLGARRPSGSLLGLQTVSSLLGPLVIVMCTLAVNLQLMRTHEGYVKWPKRISNTAAWWAISDNWESTVVFQTCFLLYISSSVVYSLGSGFRAALYYNYALLSSWFLLMAMSSAALLLPQSQLSFMFHSANEQFNRIGAENQVWLAYQSQSDGHPSPAMPLDLRITIWLITMCSAALMMAWEYFIVFGSTATTKQARRSRFNYF